MEETQTIAPAGGDQTVSFGEWIGTLLIIFLVPIVNIILLFVWAFGANTKTSKANFAKAYLLLVAIGIVIYLIFVVAIIGSVGVSNM